MITSEAVPFSKSGGLADVAGSLPPALIAKGFDTRIVVPAYNTKLEDAGDFECKFDIPMLSTSEHIVITSKVVNKTKYYFVCHPWFCERKGIYGDTSFAPYEDNLERFSLFDKAALYMCINLNWQPDVIHCHDWTSGLIPVFMKDLNSIFFMNTKTVFTIHNLAYQGIFSRMGFLLTDSKPNESSFSNGQLNMMQSGIATSDYITTVSPTYAKEIQSPEQGCRLDHILVKRSAYLKGIVNGIDIDEWNPETDKLIPEHFSVNDFSGKTKLKKLIQEQFNLPVAPDVPLFAMISRLASQKGFDALLGCLERMLKNMRIQFVIIGTGDSSIENQLLDIASRNSNLSVNILFSNKAAHLVEAGSDFFLMPSRYEPCGLNQLYSLRYGTIPIARQTGGLADTISDLDDDPLHGTGLLFGNLSPETIYNHVEKAVMLYKRDDFNSIRKRAMSQDFSWSASADEYIKVYKQLTNDR